MKVIILFLCSILCVACIKKDKDTGGSTPDLKFYGSVDPDISFYAYYSFRLTSDKRKCKSWGFNLFNGGFKLDQDYKTIEISPTINSKNYTLTIPLSNMNKHKSCNPRIESVTFCIADKLALGYSCGSAIEILGRYGSSSKQSQPKITAYEGISGLIKCYFPGEHDRCTYSKSIGEINKSEKKHSYRIDIQSEDRQPQLDEILDIELDTTHDKFNDELNITWAPIKEADYYILQTQESSCHRTFIPPELSYQHKLKCADWDFRILAMKGFPYGRCEGHVIARSSDENTYMSSSEFAPLRSDNDKENPSAFNLVPILQQPNNSLIVSGVYGDSEPGWKAFDGNEATAWTSGVRETPAIIGYKFGKPTIVKEYVLVYANGTKKNRAPKDFSLQASNDGQSWETIDAQINQINWNCYDRRRYSIDNTQAYTHYRLSIEDDNDKREGVVLITLAELELRGSIGGAEVVAHMPARKDAPEVASENIIEPKLTSAQRKQNESLIVSGVYSKSYPGWHAFDDQANTMWISKAWETPAILGYIFDEPKVVKAYSLVYSNGRLTSRAPKDFTLQASNDGQSWKIINKQINQTKWRGSETRLYAVGNKQAYTHYRLVVDDDNDRRGGVVVISLGEFELRGH